jgi:hypothetical protein
MYLKDPLGRVASTAVFKQRQFNSGLFGLADTHCSKVPVNASLSRRQSSARTAYHCADIETVWFTQYVLGSRHRTGHTGVKELV